MTNQFTATWASGQIANNVELASRIESMVNNYWNSRAQFARMFVDPRRDIEEECGYPSTIEPGLYRELYDRYAVPERVCQLMPKESWQVSPTVAEDEDADSVTKFEKAWDELGQKLSMSGKSWYKDEHGSMIWSELLRADILSGIGSFGVILLGIKDGLPLDTPAKGAEVPKDGNPKDISGIGDPVSKSIYGDTPNNIQPISRMGTDAQYWTSQYSTVQKGFSNGKSKKNSKDGELLFTWCFDESLVQIVQYEASIFSPRFGQPLMYRITLHDPRQPHIGVGLPMATLNVHWTRVIHLADNLQSSRIFGAPRMRPVLNNVLDLRKLYGGSAEMFWRAAFMGLSFETHPQLGGEVDVNQDKIKTAIRDYFMGLDRALVTTGMSAKPLAPQVSDPTAHIDKQLEAICIQIGCPVRVFKGSERGELASSQDDSAWNDRLRFRQANYNTPRIIAPFIDRLIMLEMLPEPEGYSVTWPDLDSVSKKDKAAIALQTTQAITAFVGGNGEAMMEPFDYLTRVLEFDEEEAQAIIDAAAKAQEEKQEDAQALADEHGMIPEAPPGFQHPEPPPPPAAGAPGGPPMPPVKVGAGQALVHPQTGKTIAKGPPAPKPAAPTKNEEFEYDFVNNRFFTANDKGGSDVQWITVRGQHIPIGSGQDKGEAIKEHFAKLKAKSEHGNGNRHGGHEHAHAEGAHEIEHGAHQAHLLHEAEEVTHALGGHVTDVHHAHEAIQAHEAAHSAHEAVSGHGGGGAHHVTLTDAGAIAASHVYGPAVKAVTALMQKVPATRATGKAIAKIHDHMTDVATKMVSKMEERYGKATAAAILGAGSLTVSTSTGAIGIPHALTHALPGRSKALVGSIPLLVVAEAGKRAGLLGPDTKVEAGLERVGGWVHAIKAAVGSAGSKVIKGTESYLHKSANLAGKGFRAGALTLTGNEQDEEYDFTMNHKDDDRITLSQDEIKKAHDDFMKELESELQKAIKGLPQDETDSQE